MHPGAERIPVVYVTTPPKGSPRKLAAEFARFLGLGPIKPRHNVTDIADAVCQILVEEHCDLVLVDEIHNLNNGTSAGEDLSDHLKYFTEHIPATFVYAGINVETSGLFTGTRGKQIAGRCVLINTASFPFHDEWRSLVATLEDALRLHRHEPGTLLQQARYLHARTGGMIGSLFHLVRAAAEMAILEGTEKISLAAAERDHDRLQRRSERPVRAPSRWQSDPGPARPRRAVPAAAAARPPGPSPRRPPLPRRDRRVLPGPARRRQLAGFRRPARLPGRGPARAAGAAEHRGAGRPRENARAGTAARGARTGAPASWAASPGPRAGPAPAPPRKGCPADAAPRPAAPSALPGGEPTSRSSACGTRSGTARGTRNNPSSTAAPPGDHGGQPAAPAADPPPGRPAVLFAFEQARRICAEWHERRGVVLPGLEERLDALGCRRQLLTGDRGRGPVPARGGAGPAAGLPAWTGPVLEENPSHLIRLGDRPGRDRRRGGKAPSGRREPCRGTKSSCSARRCSWPAGPAPAGSPARSAAPSPRATPGFPCPLQPGRATGRMGPGPRRRAGKHFRELPLPTAV